MTTIKPARPSQRRTTEQYTYFRQANAKRKRRNAAFAEWLANRPAKSEETPPRRGEIAPRLRESSPLDIPEKNQKGNRG